MAIAGVGNGGFWPAQSTLIAGLTKPDKRPPAYAMQRVVMNLGIGLGAVAGGVIATTDRPGSFAVLFLFDAATFLAYLTVLYGFVPEPGTARAHREQPDATSRCCATARSWACSPSTRCSSSPASPASSC